MNRDRSAAVGLVVVAGSAAMLGGGLFTAWFVLRNSEGTLNEWLAPEPPAHELAILLLSLVGSLAVGMRLKLGTWHRREASSILAVMVALAICALRVSAWVDWVPGGPGMPTGSAFIFLFTGLHFAVTAASLIVLVWRIIAQPEYGCRESSLAFRLCHVATCVEVFVYGMTIWSSK